MMTDALLAYLHYLAIFGVFAHLALEFGLLRGPLDAQRVQRLARADLVYFLTAMAALATGLLRAFYGTKGWSFYAGNPVFHLKIGTYVAIALVSLPPTFAFTRWRKALATNPNALPADAEVVKVRRLVMVEMLMLTLLPLWAVLMARGIGT